VSTNSRRYRKKPLAVHEHGTRVYAPSNGEDCYRVIATDVTGRRVFHKFALEDDARAKARELEAYLSSRTPIYGARTATALWVCWRASTWTISPAGPCATANGRTGSFAAGSSPPCATPTSSSGRRLCRRASSVRRDWS
jgi:hypothetical protein